MPLGGALARAVAPQFHDVPAGDDAAVGRCRHARYLPSERHDLAAERPDRERVARGDADHLARRRRARDVVREREADHDVLHHVRRQVGEDALRLRLRLHRLPLPQIRRFLGRLEGGGGGGSSFLGI